MPFNYSDKWNVGPKYDAWFLIPSSVCSYEDDNLVVKIIIFILEIKKGNK